MATNSWLVDPANNIELQITIQEISPVSTSILQKYNGAFDNRPKSFWAGSTPFAVGIKCTFTTTADFEDTKRKLSYFEKTGVQCLLILGSEQEGLLGRVENVSFPTTVERLNIIPVEFQFIANGTVLGYGKEAEACTHSSGDPDVVDATASGGYVSQLNGLNEAIYFQVVQSVWALPLGNYRMYVRAKDSAQVTDDLRLIVLSNGGSVAVDLLTATASYTWYSLDFTLGATEVGETIRFSVEKALATANTISVDMIVVVMRN